MGLLQSMEKISRWMLQQRGFASRQVATSAGRIQVYDGDGTGKLPPIIVLHGVGSNVAPYLRVMTRLQRASRRIIAPEAPGHGLSEMPPAGLTPDLVFSGVSEALMATIDEPAIVFGNSLGGGMALRLAMDFPDRVLGLVLSSPAGAPLPEDEWQPFLQTFRVETRQDAHAFLGKIYDRVPWYAPLLTRDLLANLKRPELQAFFDNVSDEHFMAPVQLAALDMPILMLWGSSERLMRDAQLHYFQEHLPEHAVIERPDKFAHSPYLEYPGRLAGRIIEFAEDL